MGEPNVSPDNPSRQSAAAPWLVCVPQLPPKPDYLRVKLRRRLQRIGALPLKSSLYVLPNRPDAVEDFEWLRIAIVEEGGEAMLWEASCLAGISDADIQRLFRDASDTEFRAITASARAIRTEALDAGELTADARTELARLRRRFTDAVSVDWFDASTRAEAELEVAAAERVDSELVEAATPEEQANSTVPRVTGCTWVTREGVFVDRIASAWLIRRFIDRRASFKFVEPKRYRPQRGELRFDMYQAEFTHEGDRCTFETLISRFGLDEAALHVLAEVVHDIDCKDEKFGRPETSGVEAILAGLVRAHPTDPRRLEAGRAVFDSLYLQFGGESK